MMTDYPIPEFESRRLEVLDQLQILDTGYEACFDRVTRLASDILDTPIALVSLVDRDRQWFKSVVGLDARETPREYAFCGHAILDDDTLVVQNALEDVRFVDNPLVTGPPDIRFYAGAPLTVEPGVRLGTLCAIDTRPRVFSRHQRRMLEDLAAMVVDELALRARVMELDRANQQLGQQTRELQHANEALANFAHLASHDMREPMKNIVNLAELVLCRADGDSVVPLTMLRDTAVGLEAMIAGYRRLSKLQLGDCATMRLADLLQRVDPTVAVQSGPEHWVHGDPVLLERVFANLFENARRHGVADSLQVQVAGSEAEPVIRVRNQVESDIRVDARLFAPFVRHDARVEGTGLGLAIVDRIVHLHGGAVEARCADGWFEVELRLVPEVRDVAC